MKKILNMAVCAGRHNIPQAYDGAIFVKELTSEQLKNPEQLEQIAYIAICNTTMAKWKNINLSTISLNLYVPGLTVAVIAAIKAAKSNNIDITLWHFDRDNNDYYSQKI